MSFADYSEPTRNPKITVSENGRKFTIINNSRLLVIKIKVDGCLINDHRERCDYLFEVSDPCTEAIYLELKGKDVEKAYSQLLSTLGYLSPRHSKVKKQCHIVASRVPKMSTSIQVLKVKLDKSHQAKLFVHTCQGEIEIKPTTG